MINETFELNATINNESSEILCRINNVTNNIDCNVSSIEDYSGVYIVTPSSQVQIIETDGKLLFDNIKIEPIPSNYGRIIWNGSTMTIV